MDMEWLAEVEPDTWDRVLRRLPYGHAVQKAPDVYGRSVQLPQGFTDWQEYTDYLIEHIMSEASQRALMRKSLEKLYRRFPEEASREYIARTAVMWVMRGDRFDTHAAQLGIGLRLRQQRLTGRRRGGNKQSASGKSCAVGADRESASQ